MHGCDFANSILRIAKIIIIAIEANILKCESANCPDRHASFLDLQQMILVVALFEHLM